MEVNDIWDKVAKTDPKLTKRVSQGARKFTAIDAYGQFMTASKVFGPAGERWGWTIKEHGELMNSVWVLVEFWWMYPEATIRCNYEVFGGSRFQTKEGKPFDPDEAFKKALTDALTKALSYLGFNSDVFLGKFDDNKYVEQRTAEVEKEELAASNKAARELMDKLEEAKDMKEVEQLRAEYYPWFEVFNANQMNDIKVVINKTKERLAESS